MNFEGPLKPEKRKKINSRFSASVWCGKAPARTNHTLTRQCLSWRVVPEAQTQQAFAVHRLHHDPIDTTSDHGKLFLGGGVVEIH